jgi:predicted metal-dependent phosphoesterase TrpH
MIAKLAEDNIIVHYDDVKRQRKGSPMITHIAAELVSKGYFKDVRKTYAEYLFRGKKYYALRPKPDPLTVIKIVKNAGGVAIFAHPWLDGTEYFLANFNEMVKAGLDGAEVETSEYRTPNYDAIKGKIITLCEKNNLVMTKGSDFHSPTFGGRLGKVWCEYDVVEILKRRLKIIN